MKSSTKDRRNIIDRVRLSEFFALTCTAFMLLTLFLVSNVFEKENENNPHRPVSAAVPVSRSIPIQPDKSETKVDDELEEKDKTD